jgi:cell division protein FtsB
MKHRDKLRALKQERHFYLDEIKKDSTLRRALISDTAQIEKFAREHYLMKKDNEDVYLVIDTTADQRR